MIPADHIAFNNDGTAWWVIPADSDLTPSFLRTFDRPCDTCGGDGQTEDFENDCDEPQPCFDCDGNGRHTYKIVVTLDNYVMSIHRVSVVPDMILPIESRAGFKYKPNVITINPRTGTIRLWLPTEPTPKSRIPMQPGLTNAAIMQAEFPAAARPGMLAVQLRVAT